MPARRSFVEKVFAKVSLFLPWSLASLAWSQTSGTHLSSSINQIRTFWFGIRDINRYQRSSLHRRLLQDEPDTKTFGKVVRHSWKPSISIYFNLCFLPRIRQTTWSNHLVPWCSLLFHFHWATEVPWGCSLHNAGGPWKAPAWPKITSYDSDTWPKDGPNLRLVGLVIQGGSFRTLVTQASWKPGWVGQVWEGSDKLMCHTL